MRVSMLGFMVIAAIGCGAKEDEVDVPGGQLGGTSGGCLAVPSPDVTVFTEDGTSSEDWGEVLVCPGVHVVVEGEDTRVYVLAGGSVEVVGQDVSVRAESGSTVEIYGEESGVHHDLDVDITDHTGAADLLECALEIDLSGVPEAC